MDAQKKGRCNRIPMYCQKHKIECRQICLTRHCPHPWLCCPSCLHPPTHNLKPLSQLQHHLRRHIDTQTHFQDTIRYNILELIKSQIHSLCGTVKSLLDEKVGERLRTDTMQTVYVNNADIKLALLEMQEEGRLREKYREMVLGIDQNEQYQRQREMRMMESERTRLKGMFFGLLEKIKDVIEGERQVKMGIRDRQRDTGNDRQSRNSFVHKQRSYSSKSGHSTSSLASKKKKLFQTTNIFKEVATKESKIKKTTAVKHSFQEESRKPLNKSEDLLRLVEERVASRMNKERMIREQPPTITINLPVKQAQGKVQIDIQPVQQPPPPPLSLPQQKPSIQQSPQSPTETTRQQTSVPFLRTLQEQPIKPRDPNQLPENRSNSLNKAQQRVITKTGLKKDPKITKKTKVISNQENDISIDLTLNVVQKKIPPKLKQDIEARLKIVPQVNSFLKQNLSEMEGVWKSPNDACWSLYFQIKDEIHSQDNRYSEERRKCKGIKCNREEEVSALEETIQKIKITSINKPRNHLILQYLIRYSAQLLVLFEGTEIKETKFLVETFLETLSNLAGGDVKGAYSYIHSNILLLKRLT